MNTLNNPKYSQYLKIIQQILLPSHLNSDLGSRLLTTRPRHRCGGCHVAGQLDHRVAGQAPGNRSTDAKAYPACSFIINQASAWSFLSASHICFPPITEATLSELFTFTYVAPPRKIRAGPACNAVTTPHLRAAHLSFSETNKANLDEKRRQQQI